MPLYLDIHRDVEGLTPEAIEEVHQRDVMLQEKYDVRVLKYWYDVNSKTAFCLMTAPDKDACETLHRQAHGNVAAEIFEVVEGK